MKTVAFDQSVLIIKESKAQHKELLEIIIPRVDRNYARQGHFHLECVLFSSTLSIQTPALGRYDQMLIFLLIYLIGTWTPN